MICVSESKCLNQRDDHVWQHAILCPQSDTTFRYLESSDESHPLVLNITFKEAVRLHSLVLNGPESKISLWVLKVFF